MEDDDDARSGSRSSSDSQTDSQSPLPSPTHPSVSIAVTPGSGHHHSGDGARVTEPVTVAASPQQALAIALPVQQPRSSGKDAGGSGGREDCWSEGATSTLIDAWGERYLELSRGNLKQKHWQEVADAVTSRDGYTKPPKTDVQCKNRIDTLKKKYKIEKNKISPSGASSWPFFHRLDLLLGPNHKPSPVPKPQPPPPPPSQPSSHPKILAGVPIRTASAQMRPRFPQRQRTSSHPAFKKMRSPPPPSASSKSEDGASSADSSDGLPPPPPSVAANGKREQQQKKKKQQQQQPRRQGTQEEVDEGRTAGLRELTEAILRFGEVYEKVESSKMQQATELEKQRMAFATELEVQRMQFFMKTQVELSQLKSRSPRRGGSRKRRRLGDVGGSSNHSNGNNNNNSSNSNNSDNHA